MHTVAEQSAPAELTGSSSLVPIIAGVLGSVAAVAVAVAAFVVYRKATSAATAQRGRAGFEGDAVPYKTPGTEMSACAKV